MSKRGGGKHKGYKNTVVIHVSSEDGTIEDTETDITEVAREISEVLEDNSGGTGQHIQTMPRTSGGVHMDPILQPWPRKGSLFSPNSRNGTVGIPEDHELELSTISSPGTIGDAMQADAGLAELPRLKERVRGSYDEEGWWKQKIPTTRRGSRWSITQIRKQFREAAIEDLYRRYWLRLQRLLLFKILVILILYGLTVTILYNAGGNLSYHHSPDSLEKVNIFLGLAIFFAFICAVLVFIRRIYLKINLVLAIAFWVWANALLFSHVPFEYDNLHALSNVYSVFYYIFLTQTMLPISRKLAVVLGAVTATVDIVLTAIFAKDLSPKDNLKIKQLVCNVLIYGCAILTGFYHKHLTDIAHRHTFLDTRRFIESDISNSRQRERQTRMKEGLLLKIIPKHLLEDMKKVLNRKIVEVDLGPKKIFHELLVERHDNVSILYADIVSFTPLTSELEPSELVKALNELFGRFDQLAKANSCMRIKMLGDCYYCVSGLPTPIPDHARNCVNMGLRMIKVIRHIRKETGVEKLDMRIGIHSGYVLSGVLGLRKWQYDVWSDDVTIANHMESGGLPGKVHITKTTKELLDGQFKTVPAEGGTRDSCILENDIETFFIEDEELEKVSIDDLMLADSRRGSGVGLHSKPSRPLQRRVSMAVYMDGWGAETPFVSLSDYMMEKTLPEKAEVNRRLERAFHLEDTESKDATGSMLASTAKEIEPFTLRFRNKENESDFNNMRDFSFKFYVSCAFIIFISVFIIQVILLKSSSGLYTCFGLGLFVFSLLIIFTTGLKFRYLNGKLPMTCHLAFRYASDALLTKMWSKIIISLISASMILITTVVPVMDCGYENKYWNMSCANGSFLIGDSTETQNTSSSRPVAWDDSPHLKEEDIDMPCLFAPYYLYTCMLTLVSCSVYLRVSHIVKIVYMLMALVVFNVMFYSVFSDLFDAFDVCLQGPDVLPFKATGTLYTVLLFITLVVLDRQIEKNLRLDYLCKIKIQKDKEEVERNELLNELLLANILPRHVAEHFTKPKRNKHDLYHQHCRNACVMFAAIPNFTAFFSTVDVSGKECLRLLNEIISTFDKLLILRQFDGVEKIKTIGSTYMAASGLDAGDDPNEDMEKREKNVVLMTKFAIAISLRLQELNQDCFYEYKLRIGIHYGDVLAGVVGAGKPQYDIWGDTVNVASRMESHGVMGKIQVHEGTAEILQKNGLACEFRDTIPIKGKGDMRVYLVSDDNALFHRSEPAIPSSDVFMQL